MYRTINPAIKTLETPSARIRNKQNNPQFAGKDIRRSLTSFPFNIDSLFPAAFPRLFMVNDA